MASAASTGRGGCGGAAAKGQSGGRASQVCSRALLVGEELESWEVEEWGAGSEREKESEGERRAESVVKQRRRATTSLTWFRLVGLDACGMLLRRDGLDGLLFDGDSGS